MKIPVYLAKDPSTPPPPAKSCGECSLCCKLLGINELQKRPNSWCQHVVKGHGCGIYATRPHSCTIFECMWLLSPDAPEEHRPDKVHAFWAHMESSNPDIPADQLPKGELITLYIDPGYPLAHTEEPLLGMAQQLFRRGFRVLALCGNKGWARMGDGWQQVKLVSRGGEYEGYYDALIP